MEGAPDARCLPRRCLRGRDPQRMGVRLGTMRVFRSPLAAEEILRMEMMSLDLTGLRRIRCIL